MPVTAFWAALHAPLLLWLSMRIIPLRYATGTAIGTGGHPALERAVRAQANFVEYGPFALLLLGLAEAAGAPGWAVGGIGALLLAGRCIHAFGMTRERENVRIRGAGMVATFIALALGAVLALVASLGVWR